jgi:hypothetical protein
MKTSEFTIFRILNTLNDKSFVGLSIEPKKRMSQILSGHGSSAPFNEDLKKYGRDVFIRQIIECHENEKEAVRRLQTFIMQHTALHPGGYNMGIGGRGSWGHVWNAEQRQKVTGTNNNRNKLTEAQVAAIFKDSRSNTAIAKDLGVSATMVYKIKNGRAWTHVTHSL